MNAKKSEIDIFGALLSLQKKIGLPALSGKLHELDLLHGSQDEEFIKKKVIHEVCCVVGIDEQYLMDNSLHSRDEKKQKSINFICCILKDNFDFDLQKIKVIFKIHESNVSRRMAFWTLYQSRSCMFPGCETSSNKSILFVRPRLGSLFTYGNLIVTCALHSNNTSKWIHDDDWWGAKH